MKRISGFGIFLAVLYLFTAAILVYYFIEGFSYYTTSFGERAHHMLYRQFKPGGIYGHGFGVVGSLMMLIMLLYSLRKRVRLFNNWGNLQKWLNIHIYFGIMGPLFIILHATFKVQGLVAISFWSMIAVALSGVVGRYLYVQIPRNIRGKELTIKELETIDQELNKRLQDEFQFNESMLTRLDQIGSVAIRAQRNTLVLFFSMLLGDFTLRSKLKRFRKEFSQTTAFSREHLHTLLRITRHKSILHRRVLLLNKVHELFHYWHVVHRPFAYIMLIIMFVHIVVTVLFGYRWVF